jgi:hypothetical protein
MATWCAGERDAIPLAHHPVLGIWRVSSHAGGRRRRRCRRHDECLLGGAQCLICRCLLGSSLVRSCAVQSSTITSPGAIGYTEEWLPLRCLLISPNQPAGPVYSNRARNEKRPLFFSSSSSSLGVPVPVPAPLFFVLRGTLR